MGQYHYIANLDRREYLHPHRFGDGLKLMEFSCSASGTLAGMSILLAASNGRGGGDLHMWTPNPDDPRGESPWIRSGLNPEQSEPEDYARLLAEHMIGRWAGDRVAIIGDYFEADDVEGFDLAASNPWRHNHNALDDEGHEQVYENGETKPGAFISEELRWTDISTVVIQTLMLDHYLRGDLEKRMSGFGGDRGPESTLLPDGKIVPIPQTAPTS